MRKPTGEKGGNRSGCPKEVRAVVDDVELFVSRLDGGPLLWTSSSGAKDDEDSRCLASCISSSNHSAAVGEGTGSTLLSLRQNMYRGHYSGYTRPSSRVKLTARL